MIEFIKKLLTVIGIKPHQLKVFINSIISPSVLQNVNNATYSKRCLLVYMTAPFKQKEISQVHQNYWQCKEMARIIGEYGYVVDVVDYENQYARLKTKYDLVVGLIPRNIPKFFNTHLKKNAIRIAYLTSMNLQVTSDNEQIRLNELYERRGVKLKPRRFSGYIQKDIESFDAAWFIGNSYNYHSYDSFKMPPVFYIKNSGYAFKWEDSSIKRDPKSFVFFGSLGAVHKGLDLLLEVFSKITTDCKLYVCAGYERENDFCEEYHNELYSKPNIVPMGFVDINSDRFKDMVQSCAYTILPSCAEGCAGSVLTVMSGGLIPIVSSVCGFSENEAIVLPDCKVETIAAYVKEYSCKDEAWIAQNSQKAIEIVNQKFSQNDFSDSVNMAIKGTLALHKDK